MSLDATQWAWRQRTSTASHKLVLLSLADRAGEEHTCWPCIDRLVADTQLNRKTVLGSIRSLQQQGFIEDTGERKGKTGRVRCYRLIGVASRHDDASRNSAGNGTIKRQNTVNENSTENGTIKQAQNRNGSETGTVPDFPENSTEIGSRNRPKIGTQNQSLEPIREPKDTSDPGGRTRDATPEPAPESESGTAKPPEHTAKPSEQEDQVTDPHAEAPAIADGKRWGSQEDLDIAYWISGQVDAFLEQDAPARRNMATWANDVRLMRHRDGRDPRHIRVLFQYAHSHSFWSSNILSPGKLRDQWTQLAAHRKREREAPNGGAHQSGRGSGGIDYGRVEW